MKKLPCKYEGCKDRRVHHEYPDTPRGVQYVEVPDDRTEKDPVFCSMTCAIMDGWMSVKYETPEEELARQKAWRDRQ